MKVLSDFDGVLTDQIEEANRVQEIFETNLFKGLGEVDAGLVKKTLGRVKTTLEASPWEHGWTWASRISAYADEDLFVRTIGYATCLDKWVEQKDADALSILSHTKKSGVENFAQLAQHGYNQMVEETKQGKRKPLDPTAVKMIHDLLDNGIEVVVVSNSGTDRIIDIFRGMGMDPASHAHQPKARFKIRGDARKFELGQNRKGFELGKYWIDTDRPTYHQIISEESPGAVIGDVFSLDLALPLFMAREGDPHLHGVQLFLRKRDYTPTWSHQFFKSAREPRAQLKILENLSEFSLH